MEVTRCEFCGTTENIYDPDSDLILCCDCDEESRVEMHDLLTYEFSEDDNVTRYLKDALGIS